MLTLNRGPLRREIEKFVKAYYVAKSSSKRDNKDRPTIVGQKLKLARHSPLGMLVDGLLQHMIDSAVVKYELANAIQVTASHESTTECARPMKLKHLATGKSFDSESAAYGQYWKNDKDGALVYVDTLRFSRYEHAEPYDVQRSYAQLMRNFNAFVDAQLLPPIKAHYVCHNEASESFVVVIVFEADSAKGLRLLSELDVDKDASKIKQIQAKLMEQLRRVSDLDRMVYALRKDDVAFSEDAPRVYILSELTDIKTGKYSDDSESILERLANSLNDNDNDLIRSHSMFHDRLRRHVVQSLLDSGAIRAS